MMSLSVRKRIALQNGKKLTQIEYLEMHCAEFCEILEDIDNRAMVADGTVPTTIQAATPAELRQLYVLANKIRKMGEKGLK